MDTKKKSKKGIKVKTKPEFVVGKIIHQKIRIVLSKYLARVDDSNDINYLNSPPPDKSDNAKLTELPSQTTAGKQVKQKSKKSTSKQDGEPKKSKKLGKVNVNFTKLFVKHYFFQDPKIRSIR